MLIGNIPGIFAESDTDCMYNVYIALMTGILYTIYAIYTITIYTIYTQWCDVHNSWPAHTLYISDERKLNIRR